LRVATEACLDLHQTKPGASSRWSRSQQWSCQLLTEAGSALVGADEGAAGQLLALQRATQVIG
jgi:hypothetical protein